MSDEKLDLILKKVEDSKSYLEYKITQIETNLAQKMDNQFKAMKGEIKALERENMGLRLDIHNLKTQLENQENEIRSNNVVFYGIGEQEKENWQDSEHLVTEIIRQQMDIAIEETEIQVAKRLNTKSWPRPILVKFTSLKKKNTIMNARKTLKGTSISINEDFGRQTRLERAELIKHMKEAREEGKRAFLNKNILKIDDKLYKYDMGRKEVVELANQKETHYPTTHADSQASLLTQTQNEQPENYDDTGKVYRERRRMPTRSTLKNSKITDSFRSESKN